jgi:ppGpp synthetase/RelA/SpoT-type nucleotidyltranferase
MDDRLQIELDALRALSGADEVRKKLLAGVSMGDPSIEDLAYLIKCRVKAHDRLVEKIVDRRAKGKPQYSAKEVTDIVGLRVLTLYRAELPALVRHFLEFVLVAQNSPMFLFVGNNIRDCLNEIIVYRASNDGDVTDDLVIKEFERLGLVCEVVPPGRPLNSVSADVKIVRKVSEYSSIHIVLWCVGVNRDARFNVPVEVQLRTAIEDVWGEIDHLLSYKFKQGKEATPIDRLHYENAVGHLKQLKRQLDNCTISADLIHQQIQNIFSGASYSVKPNVAARSVDTERLLNLDLSADIKKEIEVCVKKIRSLFDKMYGGGWPKEDSDVVEAVSEFEVVAKTLNDCFVEYSRNPSKNPKIDRDVTYYLKMERCLCLYWVSYLKKKELPGKEGI